MSKQQHDRKALGKGLSALLPGKPAAKPVSHLEAPKTTEPETQQGIQQIPIDRIDPNPEQPRTVFQQERLTELAQSIQSNGIIQPLVLRKAGDRYQLVAGERRWRAAKLAGLAAVPAVVQEFAKDRLLEIALIENIQREDLNAIEVAHALERLATEHQLSHEEIGQRTGKDRATVSNLIRLLKLPNPVQGLVADNQLSMGHARALLGLSSPEEQLELGQRIANNGLSVRQTEKLIQSLASKRQAVELTDQPLSPKDDPNVAAAARELESVLGTRVRIVPQSPTRGRIEIEYFSQDELDRLYEHIVGDQK